MADEVGALQARIEELKSEQAAAIKGIQAEAAVRRVALLWLS